MNKKTIVKLIAVLALCFLIGGALVACKGETGPAGPQGPQGDKGETGAAGTNGTNGTNGVDGLTPFIGENGNWWIGDEDTKVPARGPQGPQGDKGETGDTTVDICNDGKHFWEDTGVVVADCSKEHDGKILEVCSACLSARVVAKDLHDWADLTDKAATCTTPGYIDGEYCTKCGKEKAAVVDPEQPALGHEWEDQPNDGWKLVIDEDAICTDAGVEMRYCAACGEHESRSTDKGVHTIEAWIFDTNATKASEGKYVANCTVCGTAVEHKLPELDAKNEDGSDVYTINTVPATCTEDGSVTYTYVANDLGKEINYTAPVEKLAKHGHKLNDVPYANYNMNTAAVEYKYADAGVIVLPYFYGEADIDGVLPKLDGINEFVNEPLNCEDEKAKNAFFQCSACSEYVDVLVYKQHNGKSVVNTAPTCCNPGSKTTVCDGCGDTLPAVEIGVIPHEYEYELVQNKDGSFDLLGKCVSATCANCPATDNTLGLEGVIEDKAAYVAPSCSNAGSKTYYYVKDGETVTKTVVVPALPHNLNGKSVEQLKDATTGVIYHNVDAGINAFVDTPFVECGKEYNAYFACTDCGHYVYIKVVRAHTYDDAVIVEATCAKDGSKTYTCNNCEEELVETLSKNDVAHTYEYKFEKNGNTYTLTTTCKICDLAPVVTTIPADDVKEKVEKDPTCQETGLKTYTYTVAGEDKVIEETLLKTEHTLPNGVLVDLTNADFLKNYMVLVNIGTEKEPVMVYAYDSALLGEFADTKFECGTVNPGHYQCDKCEGTVLVEYVYQQHDWSTEGEGLGDATCEEDGYAKCTLCGETAVHEEALGHKYTNYVINTIADNHANCTIVASCDNGCGKTDTKTIVLPDLSDARYIKTAGTPTCVADGTDVYKIGIDKKTFELVKITDENANAVIVVAFEEVAPKTGHDDKADVNVADLITFVEGNVEYKVYVCHCGAYIVYSATPVVDTPAVDTPELV